MTSHKSRWTYRGHTAVDLAVNVTWRPKVLILIFRNLATWLGREGKIEEMSDQESFSSSRGKDTDMFIY